MSISATGSEHALVYLLGAGASHPSLPLAREVPSRMIHWGKLLSELPRESAEPNTGHRFQEMSEEMVSWGTEASGHYSVDTLAKKLFLTHKRDELWRLKASMSAFFMLEQATRRAEQRYDSFFAAVLESPGKPPTLPDNVWILTWNYDLQLERAYYQYCPDLSGVYDNITNCNRIVRLNGLLGRAINKGTGDEYNLDLSVDKNTVFSQVAKEYWQLRANEPIITFAFEKQNLEPQLKPLSKKKCTLVVVGYSFPFFNRRFDKLILQSFLEVDRVVLQVLPEHAAAIEKRMSALRSLPNFEIVDDRDQFFVPYEHES